MHSLTLSPGFVQKTHFSTTFKTISVYLACNQVELALGSSQTMRNSLISQSCQNVLTNKVNFKNQFPVQADTSKGCKYQIWRNLNIYFLAQASKCVHVLKLLFLRPLLTMYLYAEFQNFKLMQTHYQMSEVDVAMPGHPLRCLLHQDSNSP